jgi:predicted nucleic acid-binding protein
VIVDTGVLFAAANRNDSNHEASKEIVASNLRLIIPALVVAEAAYLVAKLSDQRRRRPLFGPSAPTGIWSKAPPQAISPVRQS